VTPRRAKTQKEIAAHAKRITQEVRFGEPAAAVVRSCFCVGPQNGDPVCPCRMENVRVIDGRYVEERDLGPAV
jgi:hypothetical protein